MAKYKVIRRCHGFRKRLWEEGQIVEIDPSENPPHHFVMIEDKDIPKVVPEKDKFALSEMNKSPEIKTGMGASLPNAGHPIAPETQVRGRGRPRKQQ